MVDQLYPAADAISHSSMQGEGATASRTGSESDVRGLLACTLIALDDSPESPGLRKNGPAFPPEPAQNRSTATPLQVSKPMSLMVAMLPSVTMFHIGAA